jgi:hypothetical protein
MSQPRCNPNKKHFDTREAASARLREIHQSPDPRCLYLPTRTLSCSCGRFVLTSAEQRKRSQGRMPARRRR